MCPDRLRSQHRSADKASIMNAQLERRTELTKQRVRVYLAHYVLRRSDNVHLYLFLFPHGTPYVY